MLRSLIIISALSIFAADLAYAGPGRARASVRVRASVNAKIRASVGRSRAVRPTRAARPVRPVRPRVRPRFRRRYLPPRGYILRRPRVYVGVGVPLVNGPYCPPEGPVYPTTPPGPRAPAAYYAPPAPAPVPDPAEPPRFGIGITAGGVGFEDRYSDDTKTADMWALLAKVRLDDEGYLWFQGELGQTIFDDELEVTKGGIYLTLDLLPQSKVRLTGLAGVGLRERPEELRPFFADPSQAADPFAELGVGIGYRFDLGNGTSLDLMLEGRAGSVQREREDAPRVSPVAESGRAISPPYRYDEVLPSEYTEGRITATINF